MGSAFVRLRGTNHPVTGMPTFSLLTEQEIDAQYQRERERVAMGSWPGSLGASLGPLRHETGWEAGQGSKNAAKRSRDTDDGNPLLTNMRLNLPPAVLDDRLELLKRIDGLNRRMDAGCRKSDAGYGFVFRASGRRGAGRRLPGI
jgi:hypothetical protein